MKKMRVPLLISLLVLVLATTAFSWGGGPCGGGRGPGYGPCAGGDMAAFSNLNLTAEQTEKISSLRETQLKETKPLRDKLFAKRGDLKLLWLEKSHDQEKIMAAQKELRSLRDQMGDKMITHRLAILKILTPEQQSKVKSSMAGRMDRGQGMCSGSGSGPGGCPGGGCR
jgi:Spy/CpxP family protein refolding chaperone